MAALLCWSATSANDPGRDAYPFDPLGSPYCTTTADLNRTTAHWLQSSLARIFDRKRYDEEMRSVGIDPTPDLGQLRPLTNPLDSAVCHRIRQALDLDWIGLGRDEERQLTVPDHYLIAFELPDGGYFAYLGLYEAGSPDGSIGPPALSHSGGYHFDENVVEVGRIGL